MNPRLLISFLLLLSLQGFGQDTIWVKYGDPGKMTTIKRAINFKTNLPDGHYATCFGNLRSHPDYDLIITDNGKRKTHTYYFNQKILSQFNYLNNQLNGPFLQYIFPPCYGLWYKGYFKDGVKDSLWTNYESEIIKDSCFRWPSTQYKYSNGNCYLISVWDKKGNALVKDGAGELRETDWINSKTTQYRNGLRDGIEVDTFDHRIENENVYQEGRILSETSYYSNGNKKIIKRWGYPKAPRVVLDSNFTDAWATEFVYEWKTVNDSVPDGKWEAYYENGTQAYEGNYSNGKKTGKWFWNSMSGKRLLDIDFEKDVWKHYDTTGKVISEAKKEYYTALMNGRWYFDYDTIRNFTLFVRKGDWAHSTFFLFQPNGEVKVHCDICMEKMTQYEIIYDIIKIEFVDSETEVKTKTRYYKIVDVNENQITLNFLTE